MTEDDRFYSTIDEYLSSVTGEYSISPKGIEELIERVSTNCFISKENAEIIVLAFFNEVRNQIIKGNEILFRGFGKLSLSSPKTSNTKKRVFVKFKPAIVFIKRLNGK